MSKLPVVETDFGVLEVEYKDGLPFIHCTILSFSKEKFKDMRAIWREVLDMFHDAGHPFVYSLLPLGDPMIKKFNSIFGMDELVVLKEGVLMYRSTE